MLKVIDIMNTGVVSVSPSTPVIEVACKMKAAGAALIAVFSKGKFYGVITVEDIVTRLVAEGTDPMNAPAGSIMNSDYHSISPDADIAEAARMMADNNIQILPVCQNGRLFGLVTLHDITLKYPEKDSTVHARIT